MINEKTLLEFQLLQHSLNLFINDVLFFDFKCLILVFHEKIYLFHLIFGLSPKIFVYFNFENSNTFFIFVNYNSIRTSRKVLIFGIQLISTYCNFKLRIIFCKYLNSSLFIRSILWTKSISQSSWMIFKLFLKLCGNFLRYSI